MQKRLARMALALSLAALCAACGGAVPHTVFPGDPRDDQTPPPPRVDAGELDAGVLADAGEAPDAGPPAPPADAGAPPPDAGTLDAGEPDAGTLDAGPADAGSPPPPAAGPRIGNCPSFPADHPMNRDVSGDPVDPRSAAFLKAMGADSLKLHPDFGAPEYGLPYATVPGSQTRVPMSFTYADQSEPGPYPFPQDVPIQGGAAGTGDRHAIVLDRDNCLLYETYDTYASGGGFRAGSGALFDLRSGAVRPNGWTSATASGLALLPGLAKPEEVLDEGELRHALLFTGSWTAHSWVYPATHSSGTSSDPDAPPLGLRVRLRADFNLTPYRGASLIILRGLKRYGMLLVDNAQPGWFWSVAGSQSARWPDADLQQIKSVPASAFEVLQLGQIHSGQ